MNGFYVSLVFLGIILVTFSLICIFLDKKKVFNFSKDIEEKKQQLVEIINDAEEMVNELNKFSDYIVNQMDLKNEELNKNIIFAEEKVNALGDRARIICNKTEAAATGIKEIDVKCMKAISAVDSEVRDTVQESYRAVAVVNGNITGVTTPGNAAMPYVEPGCDTTGIPYKKKEKVIHINNKYSEVLRLSQDGMQSLEIAKKLNLGKGEVELILDLRK